MVRFLFAVARRVQRNLATRQSDRLQGERFYSLSLDAYSGTLPSSASL